MTFIIEIFALVAFGSCVVSATTTSTSYTDSIYVFTAVSIQALSPRGIRVSIPHTPGIQLFAFHGNINSPLFDLEAGQLSRDVLHREGNSWVFKDRSVQLKVGDKIYYWLYVQKDNLGYRQDNGFYEVKDIIPDDFYNRPQTDEDVRANPPPTVQDNLRLCEKVVFNLTRAMIEIHYDIDSLRQENDILRKMAERHPKQSRTLTLDGTTNVKDDELQTLVQAVVSQKLGLSVRVENVTRKNNTMVTFQVPTISDAIAVIREGEKKLKNSRYTVLY